MDIQYYGGNCIKINSKKASVVIDDNLATLGGSEVVRAGDIVLYTGEVSQPSTREVKFMVSRPGDYEISDIAIMGIAARAHVDEQGKKSATMYKIVADDVRIAVVGHIYPELSEAQLEDLGVIDILVIPVGGSGFTLDPVGALTIIKELEPKIIIPTNYDDPKLTYPVPAIKLEVALKGLALEVKETVPKLKIKGTELLTDQAQLIVLERQ